MHRRIASRVRAGFTLLELMIVVAIIGILAATAMPAFQSYLMRSRANEGRMMIEIVKLRQESYRAEFGAYLTAAANPGAIDGINYVPWPLTPDWTALGFTPPANRTRFQMSAIAGPPVLGGPGIAGLTGNDFWYVLQASGDLDGDGNLLIFQGYSEADFIFCNQQKDWE